MSHCLSSQCAVGHEYVADVGKHSSQTDAAQGFGGKFGVQRDRADKVCWAVQLKSVPVACAAPGACHMLAWGCCQSSGHAGCALCPGLIEAQLSCVQGSGPTVWGSRGAAGVRCCAGPVPPRQNTFSRGCGVCPCVLQH